MQVQQHETVLNYISLMWLFNKKKKYYPLEIDWIVKLFTYATVAGDKQT